MTHPLRSQERASLFTDVSARSARESSWDRTGANQDYIRVDPGTTVTLLDRAGPGCVTHLYLATVLADVTDYRDAILRCYWDGADEPSVQVPLGDFFGVAHGRIREFRSAMVAVNPGLGGGSHALNSYFPMPFRSWARITLENRGEAMLGGALGNLWYHIDYETYEDALPDDVLYFHASYRQERPTTAKGDEPNVTLHDAINVDGADNFVALETKGRGKMAGLVLEIENLQGTNWYGEGDDMVFIDGETWPPSIHGTGSEEIFGAGACPTEEYAGPYAGYHLIDSIDYSGLVGMYRWFVPDPIQFTSELRWTIEHGHANNFANNYATVVHWYQDPLTAAAELPSRDEMLPPLGPGYEEAKKALFDLVSKRRQAVGDGAPLIDYLRTARLGRPFTRGDWAGTIGELERLPGGGE